jgi:glutaredoxin
VPPTVITLYGREGCHLCEEARVAIEALAGELGGIELREVDIETDEGLLRTHLERIPVVELDGREVSSLVLDPEALRAALELHTVGP